MTLNLLRKLMKYRKLDLTRVDAVLQQMSKEQRRTMAFIAFRLLMPMTRKKRAKPACLSSVMKATVELYERQKDGRESAEYQSEYRS